MAAHPVGRGIQEEVCETLETDSVVTKKEKQRCFQRCYSRVDQS